MRWWPKPTSSSPTSRSSISSIRTTTSTIWVACAASWRKAQPSSPTTRTATSTSASCWRRRRQHDAMVEVAVLVVGDDGCAFRHEAAHATQMVEVVVRIDEILDRLVGEELVGFGHQRVGALIAERPLDHHDIVLELDGDAVVRAAAQEDDAGGELR